MHLYAYLSIVRHQTKVIRIPKIGKAVDRVVVGITGASGIPYGIRLLEVLKEFDVEIHLTCSPSASLVNDHEGDGRSLSLIHI